MSGAVPPRVDSSPRNPVLPGFHPDPSACRVGDWFYLATSSFHFFPGIPLRRSRDLVGWELAGYAISRPGQLDLRGTPSSRGLFAPTLRHDGRRFHLTCTEVDRLGNFLVSAPAIEGPWSDPKPLPVGGIDPALHFDGEGRAWLLSNGEVEGRPGIALSAIDVDSGRILEGPRRICPGSGGRWPEGPRLFERGGAWYLLVSEGGTEYGHYLGCFRAASPWGPWEACPRNPILSHRDDAASPIQCVGHADLVEDGAGGWWLLCLGVRPLGPLLHNLGRETFLAPVAWDDDGWPLVGAPGKPGRVGLGIEDSPRGHPGPRAAARAAGWSDDFRGPELGLEWVSPRAREPGAAAILPGGGLGLRGGAVGLSEPGAAPALVARPQGEFECRFEAELDFQPASEGSEAGIVAYYDEDYHYEAFVTRFSEARVVALRRRVHDLEAESPAVAIPAEGIVRLTLRADRDRYAFSWACGGEGGELGSGLAAGLCTEGTWRMSFTGVHLGLYCVAGEARFARASCVDGPAAP